MRILIFAILISFFANISLKSQENESLQRCNWHGENWEDVDSTIYFFNTDTNIVVGRNTLYYEINGNLQLIYQFNQYNNSFIVDFDILNNNTWYVILNGFLYKTLDKGNNWIQDTTYYPAAISIFGTYGVSRLHIYQQTDTFFLFGGYYSSFVLFSTDQGQSWSKSFSNVFIAFYQGMIFCDDRVFIWSEQGDPFYANMFEVNFDSLFTGTYTPPECGVGGDSISQSPDCYYSLVSSGSCDAAYQEFLVLTDSICQLSLATNKITKEEDELIVYPNPANDLLLIKTTNSSVEKCFYKIENIFTGSILMQGYLSKESIVNIKDLPNGSYLLSLKESNITYHKKFIVSKH